MNPTLPRAHSGGDRAAPCLALWWRGAGCRTHHTDAFFIRSVAIRHDASTYMHGRVVTDRNATHGKRIRVGRGYGSAAGRAANQGSLFLGRCVVLCRVGIGWILVASVATLPLEEITLE